MVLRALHRIGWMVKRQSGSHRTLARSAAVLIEAGKPSPGYVKPATDDEIDGFKLLHGGPEIVRTWGNQARRRVAIALERFNAIHARQSASDRSAFSRWLRGLSPRQLQIFVWALGEAR